MVKSMNVILETIIKGMVVWSLLTPRIQPALGTPYPTCANDQQKCALGCITVPILAASHSWGYSSKKVFCVNNNSPAAGTTYRLRGCPTTFFDALQNTSGVCSITNDDNTTDLLVTTNELSTGLHSFDCPLSESPTGMISRSAIVVNDDAPYRDDLIYINGVQQYQYNSTNITLEVGDSVAVVVRAVGNVSVISVDASDPRFTCVTGFACNKYTSYGVQNRYLKCFLNSPAELTDSGKTLTVSIDNIEVSRFVFTVMNNSVDTEVEPANKPNTTTGTTTTGTTTSSNSSTDKEDTDDNLWAYAGLWIGMGIGIVLIIVVLGILGIWWLRNRSLCDSRREEEGAVLHEQNDNNRKSVDSMESQVFQDFHERLVNTLPVEEIKHKLVPPGILSLDDIQEIDAKDRARDKAGVILRIVKSSLDTSFCTLLDKMEESHYETAKKLAEEIREALKTGQGIINSRYSMGQDGGE